jgi:hypothetical protein
MLRSPDVPFDTVIFLMSKWMASETVETLSTWQKVWMDLLRPRAQSVHGGTFIGCS